MKRKFDLLALRDKTSTEDRQAAARALHEDLIETELKATNTTAVVPISTDQSAVPSTSASTNQNTAGATQSDVVCKDEEEAQVEKRGRGRKKLGGGENERAGRQLLSSQQKKPLYGLNPFSIPIKYLNPKVKPKLKQDSNPFLPATD